MKVELGGGGGGLLQNRKGHFSTYGEMAGEHWPVGIHRCAELVLQCSGFNSTVTTGPEVPSAQIPDLSWILLTDSIPWNKSLVP